MARIPSNVTTGEAAKGGGAVQAERNPSDSDGMPADESQFEQVPFQAVKGNATGSKHGGAPVASGANPAMPGSIPLTGHSFMANPAKGNSPKRSAGSRTPAQNPAKPSVSA